MKNRVSAILCFFDLPQFIEVFASNFKIENDNRFGNLDSLRGFCFARSVVLKYEGLLRGAWTKRRVIKVK